ncbi:SnoaL-like domain-containing protein [Nonomuraea sp. NN258]|uniref:ester cyclase n=1 Tax=Nonomuraea antri TaxID=2730852 RepID=UPI0015686EED|nr:nuclear transport factor 2 family protein [Nonomuraea antri]NRQ36608.1 SnoaL-like domain-containing protein [Nonomuraea antri]
MSMSAGEVHRRLVEMYPRLVAAGRFDEGLALIDPAVVDHRGGADGDHHGIGAWRRKWESMLGGADEFGDLAVTVERNVSAGDLSANLYRSRGTQPASGRRYEVWAMDLVQVRDGKVVEHWAIRDTAAVRHQLGL